ncbi:MAG: gliding motility-associated-like protein [Parvicellaceae bacterium]
MKNLRLHTVALLFIVFSCFTAEAQLAWTFVNELTDANKVHVLAVKADPANSVVYVVGEFSADLSGVFTTGLNGTPDFSTNNGGADGFVAKYQENGTLLWAFMVGGAGADKVKDIDLDASGDLYITGSFETAGEFRGTEITSFPNLTAFGGVDIFQAKYDSDGKIIWLHEDGGTGTDNGTHVEVQGPRVLFAGDYVVSGYTEIAGFNPITYGGQDVFVLSRNPAGATIWYCDGGSNSNDAIGGLTIDPAGDTVYMAVNYSGVSMTYVDNGSNSTPAQLNSDVGFNDISYVAFAANSGLFSWVNQISGTDDEICEDLVGDAFNLYIVGSYQNSINVPVVGAGPANTSDDIFIASVINDLGPGQWLVTEPTTGATDASAKAACLDLAGNVWAVAEFSGTANVDGSFPEVSSGGKDLLVLEYDATGAYLYHNVAKSTLDISPEDITIDASNNLYFGGYSFANSTFGTITTTSTGASDGFFSKLSVCDASYSYSSASFCSGNPNVLPTITGNLGGIFTEGSGNITFVSSSTGEIDLTGSITGGPFAITYTAPGGCSQVFNVSVTANANPVFSFCPVNSSTSNDAGLCSAVVSYSAPTAMDDCGSVTITQTDGSGLTSGSAFPIGVTAQQYTATDLAGNTTLCSFTVTVVDSEVPVIACPSNVTQNNGLGLCGSVVTYASPIGTDNCASPVTTQTAGLASGSTFPVGITVNTFLVTDASGNTVTCSFNVTISDTENPAIACPANVVQGNDIGVCGASVAYSVPVGTDNCPGSITTQTAGLSSGSTFPIGTTLNTFLVTDAAGNSAACSFNVTITDTESPAIVCPSNLTISNDAGLCSAVVTYLAPTGTDNCPGSLTSQSTGMPSGSAFPVGTTINTFIVTDAAGNSTFCSFSVLVNDTEMPSMSCPSNVSIVNDIGACGAAVTYVDPVGADNCPGMATAQIAGLSSGSVFPLGTTINTFETTDASGNTSSCSFNVDVTDSELPTLICPGNITQGNDLDSCNAVVTYVTPIGADNCPGYIVVQSEGIPSGSVFPQGITLNKFIVTDAAGNEDSCNFTVTVNDTQSPTIACPFNVFQLNDTDSCGAIVTFPALVASDNCSGTTITQTSGQGSGTFFPIGVTLNSFQVTDAAGNISACSFTVTITDDQVPVFACPADVNLDNDVDSCGTIFSFGNPISSDNCGIDTTYQTSGLLDNSLFPVGVSTLTFYALDNYGNSSTCSYQVIVTDTSSPTILCPSDTIICDSLITYAPVVGADNCVVPIITQTDVSGLTSGNTFPLGITAQTYQAIDASGNISTCTFNVEVLAPIYPYWDSLPSQVCELTDTIDLAALVTSTLGTFSGAGVSGSNFIPVNAGVGTATITFTVSNSTCFRDSVQTILVLADPVINAGLDDSICGVNYNLVGSSNFPGFWSSLTCSFADSTNPSTVLTTPGFGVQYAVWNVVSPPQCSVSDSVLIRFDEQGFADAGADQLVLDQLETNLDALQSSVGNSSWFLLNGTGSFGNDNFESSLFTASGYGVYDIEWIIESGSCPISSDVLTIEFLELIIPQGISPNSDGLNDSFIIPGLSLFLEKDLKIYDRWGKTVYVNGSYNNDWGGSNHSGEQLLDDTYFYELTLDSRQMTGFVVIKN